MTPDFRLIVEATPIERLPDLIGDLAAAQARAQLRLHAAAPPPPEPTKPAAGPRWLPAREALAIVRGRDIERITRNELRALYAWGKGKSWCSRTGRRSVQIELGGLERFLASRAG